MSNKQELKGALAECQLILEAFENKDSLNRQIVTQPMTYFRVRIAELKRQITEAEQ